VLRIYRDFVADAPDGLGHVIRPGMVPQQEHPARQGLHLNQ